VVDKEGNIRYTVVPGTPVPHDPTIWADVDVKRLPKAVRKARQEWMAAKRPPRKDALQKERKHKRSLEKKRSRNSE
jgi:hypothetical protein